MTYDLRVGAGCRVSSEEFDFHTTGSVVDIDKELNWLPTNVTFPAPSSQPLPDPVETEGCPRILPAACDNVGNPRCGRCGPNVGSVHMLLPKLPLPETQGHNCCA
jgi:hypothetical protein